MRRSAARFVRLALSAVALGSSLAAHAEDTPRQVCPPVAQDVVINGAIDEWDTTSAIELGEAELIRRDAGYRGPDDLSGRVYVARSATTLYVAGEIRDDTVSVNAQRPSAGDSVEICLDFHPRPEARPAEGGEPGYDSYAHQLVLQPLAGEGGWRFVRFKGRAGRPDDAVDGVELAGLPWRDAKGATIGYRFELALPFSNFPAAPSEEGGAFGFDVSVTDADGAPEVRNVAAWSGRRDTGLFPGRLGRLELGRPPRAVVAPESLATSTIGPAAVLVALVGALLFLWLARTARPSGSWLGARLGALHRVPLRFKAVACATIAALIAAAGFLADGATRALEARDVEEKRGLVALARAISEEAAANHLGAAQLPQHASPLISLLAGRGVKAPDEFDCTIVPSAPETPNRTLSGIPYLRRDIPATAAWSGSFVVHPPLAVARVTAILSWADDPGDDRPPQSGDTVAEIRLVRDDGTVDPPEAIVWGRHLDAATDPAGPAAHVGAPESQVAFVSPAPVAGGRGAEHADEVTFAVAASESPVHRVEIAQIADGGSLRIHGVTLSPVGGSAPVPLPLGRATQRGVPTAAPPFPAETQGLLLSRERPKASVACDASADRVWLVASLRHGFGDARFGAQTALVRAHFSDGSVEGPFRLENGVNIDAEETPARQHGESYQSEVAFEWGEPRRHFDAIQIEFEARDRRLTSLAFEWTGEDEVVRIASITAGRRTEPRRPGALRHLVDTPDGYRAVPADLSRLAGLTFTLFRDGGAVATTATDDLRGRTLARTLTPPESIAAARTPGGVHAVTSDEDRRLHTLAVGLPGARVLELAWSSDVESKVEEQVAVVRAVLAVLLAPLLVLLVADLVLRIPSLHVRLVAATAAVAAAPVAFGWFAVPVLLGSSIENRERHAAELKLAAVRTRLAAVGSSLRQRAETALRDEALTEALRHRGAPEYRTAVAAALRDVEHATGGGARLALEVRPLSSSGEPAVFPPQAQWSVFADPGGPPSGEIALRQSRLRAAGAAHRFDTTGNWRTTLVVEAPIDRAALADLASAAGASVQALLFTPRGYPIAATIESQGDDAPDEMRRKTRIVQRVLAEQQPVVETRVLSGTPHTVAFDVVRGEQGVVALLAAAVPRAATESLLRRIGLVAVLVFGAGVLMQFLVAGVIVESTTRSFRTLLDRARAAAGAAALTPADELGALGASLAAVAAARDTHAAGLAHLASALPELAAGATPQQVAEAAVAAALRALSPWGVLVLAADGDGRVEVLAGRRGGETVARAPVVVTGSHPLVPVIAGEREAHLAAGDYAPEISVRGDRPLLGGAARIDAWPLAAASATGGALLVLTTGAEPSADAPRTHDRFLAVLARATGVALTAARLARQSVQDADTGALVPRQFEDRLRAEVDRALAGRQHVALVLVRAARLPPDPSQARRALQQLADALRAAAPRAAFVGRLEPGLLAAALPETDRAGAADTAAALARIAADRGLAAIGITCGVAACPDDAGSHEFLVAEARRVLGAPEPAAAAALRAPVPADDAAPRPVPSPRERGAVFESEGGAKLLATVDRIAPGALPVLVEGEPGSGKEFLAELIHAKSGRGAGPLVKVNCAALPDALLESELFGYERGAFSGADRDRRGRFELANGGTIYLDEIADVPLATQVKLLAVLEDRAVERLGGTAPSPVDVRVIAATSRDLRAALAEGRFREDLYYRLAGVTLQVPPLRARRDDIAALAARFAADAALGRGRPAPTFDPAAVDRLLRHSWPGNVRELKEVAERAAALAVGDVIRAEDLGALIHDAPRHDPAVRRDAAPRPEPPRTSPAGISDRQRRLLGLLGEREWVTNADYCDLVGVSQRTGLRDLGELLDRGVIVMEGKRRGARYRLR